MDNYPPSEVQRVQSEEVVLENPSFYGRMKNRAKNAAYSMGRGVRSVGSYAYNQIPGRNGNFNVLTQTGNNRSAFDLATGTNSFERDQNRFQNQVKAASALGSAASGLFSMLRGKGGRTQKIKRKLRKPKAKKSRKRRVTRKRN
jgi:hypothetical protein